MMVFLCACEKNSGDDGPKPWAAPSDAETKQSETETTRSEELETLEEITAADGEITLPAGIKQEDIAKLERMIWSGFFDAGYDRETAKAKDVMRFIAIDNLPIGIFYILQTTDPDGKLGICEQKYVDTEKDPKGLFGFSYFKIEEKVIEFLFREIFGVNIDKSLQNDFYYIEDGFWYFCCDPTGLDDTVTKARACQTLGDGMYRITMENLYRDMDGSTEHISSAFVDAKLSERDGVRYWELYKVEAFE